MSMSSDDAQRELERKALRNVRELVDKMENSYEADAHTQRRLLIAIVIGTFVLALAIAAAIVFSGERSRPAAIDPSQLPPVRAGPPK
jgi:flagellar basal body-associated protein FliL